MSVKLRNIKKVIVDNWDHYNALTSESLDDKTDEFFDYCLKRSGALFDDASEREGYLDVCWLLNWPEERVSLPSHHDRTLRKKIKRVRFRESKTEPMTDPTQLIGTEKRLVRWLRKHVSTSWSSVQRAFNGYSKRQQNDFVRSHLAVMLDMYVEEHPTLRKGVYLYYGSDEPIHGPGMFFVDSSGILREAPLQSLG